MMFYLKLYLEIGIVFAIFGLSCAKLLKAPLTWNHVILLLFNSLVLWPVLLVAFTLEFVSFFRRGSFEKVLKHEIEDLERARLEYLERKRLAEIKGDDSNV